MKNSLAGIYRCRRSFKLFGFLTLAYLFFFAVVPRANASSWEDAIEKVKLRAEEYHKKATALGWSIHAGTIFNEWHVAEHKCSILGRMLGHGSLVKHLEEDYPSNSRTGEEFRLAAISLDNWAHVAERLLKLDRQRQIRSWNLDCVGQMEIPRSAYIPEGKEQAFFDVSGGILRVLGNVEQGFTDRLFEAIRANPGIKYVALGSGGGSVSEALSAGRLIRRFKLETTLWNNCYSACSIVFLGGLKRTIWSPFPKLGFHMVSVNGIAVSRNSPIYAEIARYVREMGADPKVFLSAMLSAPPNEMHYITHDEMCKADITTWIQRTCWSASGP